MNNIVLMPGKFLSTLSLRRATVCPPVGSLVLFISIHALLAESDQRYHRQAADRGYFYPRSPCGERLPACWRGCSLRYNFYPRSPCGERLHEALHRGRLLPISIHALLAESDPGPKSTTPDKYYFYPRSPCGERRGPRWKECRHPPFLSTLSLRRATPK